MRRRNVALYVGAALAAGVGYLVFFHGSARDPVEFLVANPALPAVAVDARGGAAIEWREQPGGRRERDVDCGGRGAIVGWSDGGGAFATPDAYTAVCVHRSRLTAWGVYKWQSMASAAGEDWPNFESWSDAETTPPGVRSRVDVHADEWELACGLGDPRGPCGVWVFRARYDHVLVVAELRHPVGGCCGFPFSAMRRFVASLDRDLTKKLGSP